MKKNSTKKAEVNINMLIAFILLITFIAIFIITLPLTNEQKPFDQMNQEEKITYTEQNEDLVLDKALMQTAISTNDYEMCDEILDRTIRNQCKDATEQFKETENTEEQTGEQRTQQETIDRANLNYAKIFQDKTYCDEIVDEVLKSKCMEQ